jgi:DTW domain-containing protein YfiP
MRAMTDATAPDAALPAAPADCPRCRKPQPLCICESVTPIDNRVALLVLQHPQEQDRTLGSARLAALHFSNALFKVGLSWPSLSKVLGREADPKRWAVLYLGSSSADKLAPGRDVVVLNRKGEALPDQDAALRDIDGVILLDGTWSQAKAIWWRNAWMLKCRRVILGPRTPSRYGGLRKEPRRDGLSTIEAAGLLLSRLERRPEIETALNASFERMLARFREVRQASPMLTRR